MRLPGRFSHYKYPPSDRPVLSVMSCPLSWSLSSSLSSCSLLLLLVFTPGLAEQDCSCLQCEPSLEVYRGTVRLVTTSSSLINISISSTTRGADQLYLRGCGCFMVFSGQGRSGRAQKIARPGLHRIESRVYVGSVFREENCDNIQRYPENFRYYNVQ